METLYRKYRPLDFDSVVGQEAIVKTLKNQIASGNISHAYLFSGTKGTGKTTVARIFARAVNCPHEEGGNPCNVCDVCKAAINEADYNILEFDAASNGNVENIRQLTDSMQYAPINDEKYKIYIIDEAHALTGFSKEAFLKSLEEPPEYIIYILATTDPNKLPETILSRCQKYNFRRISIDDIVGRLKVICEAENIVIDEDALYFIAEKSDGSLRESISKLDRCRSFPYDRLTRDIILDILGLTDDDFFMLITKAINEGDIETAFDTLGKTLNNGSDLYQFTSDLIWFLRNILVAKNINKPLESLNITKTNFEKYKEFSKNISKDVLIYYIEELSKTLNIMKYDENRRAILETAIIRLANPETNFIESAVMARLKKIEELKNSGSFINVSHTESASHDESSPKETLPKKENKIKEVTLSKITYDEINLIKDNWQAIKSTLNMTAKSILTSADIIPGSEKEPGFIQILLSDIDYNILSDMNLIKTIETSLAESTKNIVKKDVVYKLIDKSKTKYADNITFKLEDGFDKIVGVPIEIEDDK